MHRKVYEKKGKEKGEMHIGISFNTFCQFLGGCFGFVVFKKQVVATAAQLFLPKCEQFFRKCLFCDKTPTVKTFHGIKIILFEF